MLYIVLTFWLNIYLSSAAVSVKDPIVLKLDEERYRVIEHEGSKYVLDLWVKESDLKEAAKYNPDMENKYFLFTRDNPNVNQPIYFGDKESLTNSNFDSRRQTVVIIHGWKNNATSMIFQVLVPAFLEAEDVNVIVVDWSAGADYNYVVAVLIVTVSGESVARFLSWLSEVSGVSLSSYHITGHSLGGHLAGVVGRNLGGQVPYITALDPAGPGWLLNPNIFRADDGVYTEVIHTNGLFLGFILPLGDVDFYPNSGVLMPGCMDDVSCSHARSFLYYAESLKSTFTGVECATLEAALEGTCMRPGSLPMGGTNPKTGQTGIFFLQTNAYPPFSKG